MFGIKLSVLMNTSTVLDQSGYRPSVESPWTQWIPWTLSMDSVDIYHGLSGQSGQCPWILRTKSSESMDKVQLDQPDWTMSMDSVDTVYGLSGHCPWTQWTVWTLSMDTIHVISPDLA